jgi:hypothetical protein
VLLGVRERPTGTGPPVKQTALHVGDRDRPAVVVRLGALFGHAVVPRGAALVGVADEHVAVDSFQDRGMRSKARRGSRQRVSVSRGHAAIARRRWP